MFKPFPQSLEGSIRRYLTDQLSDGPRKCINAPSGFSFALGTDIGKVRHENQDRSILAKLPGATASGERFVGVLCDGIGGMAGGAQAAALAVSSFISYLLCSAERKPETLLREAALHANSVVHQRLTGIGGAVLSAFIWDGGSAQILNVGDARIYGISTEYTLKQLSTDDTLEGQLLALGKVPTPHPESHKLLQYIGSEQPPEPHIQAIATSTLRGLLLTTDGAHSTPHAVMQFAIASSKATPKTAIEHLLDLARWAGGADNSSAILFNLNHRDRQQELFSDDRHCELWTPTGAFSIWNAVDQANSNRPSQPHLFPVRHEPATSKSPQKPKRGRTYWHHLPVEQTPIGESPPPIVPVITFTESDPESSEQPSPTPEIQPSVKLRDR